MSARWRTTTRSSTAGPLCNCCWKRPDQLCRGAGRGHGTARWRAGGLLPRPRDRQPTGAAARWPAAGASSPTSAQSCTGAGRLGTQFRRHSAATVAGRQSGRRPLQQTCPTSTAHPATTTALEGDPPGSVGRAFNAHRRRAARHLAEHRASLPRRRQPASARLGATIISQRGSRMTPSLNIGN